MAIADSEGKISNADGVSEVEPFDIYNAPERCRELLRRISQMANPAVSLPWKWDILEFLEESRQQLRSARQANTSPTVGIWAEIFEATESEQTASTLPIGLRKQCEELLGRREIWLGDFDSELRAILTRGRELRERLLFEDVDRAGWFSASGVSPLEVQRLLERHLDMHQRAGRLGRQLKLLRRALQQQGAVSSRRRAFQAKTMGEKLQSSLVCLAAVAVAPVPGSSEMWLASTTMMWLDKDQAWQHVVYEHPRDADTETILSQFQCRSRKARQALASWLAMPPPARRGCVLIHNASVRRVFVKTHIVNCIDGSGDPSGDWISALDHHPLGSVMKKALTFNSMDLETIVIGAQRVAVIRLPQKPDANWGWRGSFAYGDTKVGECRLREGGVFSFICVDAGLHVGDREEGDICTPGGAAMGHSFISEVAEEDDKLEAGTKPTRLMSHNPTNPFEQDLVSSAGADTNPFSSSLDGNASRSSARGASEVSRNHNGGQDSVDGGGLVQAALAASAVTAVEQPMTPGTIVSEAGATGLAHGGEPPHGEKGEKGEDGEDESPLTAIEVANRTDDPVGVRIFEPKGGGHAATRLFRSSLEDTTLQPGTRQVFWLKGNMDGSETDFDVEVRIGLRKARCEVVGGQVILVDGILQND